MTDAEALRARRKDHVNTENTPNSKLALLEWISCAEASAPRSRTDVSRSRRTLAPDCKLTGAKGELAYPEVEEPPRRAFHFSYSARGMNRSDALLMQ